MKKILMGGLFMGLLTFTALSSDAQTGLGINAGVNFANITGKDAFDDAKLKTGFQAGITYDIPVGDEFVIQPGLSYIQNGAKIGGSIGDWGNDPKVHLNYLQLPVLFQYQPELGDGKMLLGVGPYVGMGIGKVKISNDNGSIDRDWDDAALKKIDAGAKLLVGYQLSNGLSLNLNGNWGLIKLDDIDDPARTFNTSFGVTVGYKF